MKFYDTHGREHKIDIRPSRWRRKGMGKSRSKFQANVGEILAERFPYCHILEEFPCLGEGLYLDFFIPIKKLAIEVQGQQHLKFNPFFHKTIADFRTQQLNDKRKEEWCAANEIRLIKIHWGEKKENIEKALA